MSLINQVLRDLDQRHASVNDRSGMPNEVRPLPASGTRRSFRFRIGMSVLLALIAAAGTWYYWQETQPLPAPVVTVPAQPVQAVPVIASATDEAQTTGSTTGPTLSAVPPALTLTPPETKADDIRLRLDLEISLPKSPPPVPAAPVTPPIERKSATEPVLAKPVVPVLARSAPQSPTVAMTPAPSVPASTNTTDEWVRAQALLRSGNSAEAEPLLKNLLEAQPALQAPRQALIGVLLAERRFAEAIPVLKQGLVHHPDQTGWAMNLARLQVDKGDYAAAWEALSISLSRAQQQPEYLAFAGTVLQRLDRSSEAVAQYQAALRQRPEEARWWVGMGIALEAAQHPGEARAAYQRARSIGGFSPEMARFIEQKLQ